MYGDERYQYCHAWALAEDGQYTEAAALYEQMGDFEDAAQRRQYCLACAAEGVKDYETALFAYEAAGSCADAEERLYNLQGQVYNRAIELKASGDYQQSIDLFNLLGNYLSSPNQAVEAKEYLRDETYQQADVLLASGDLQGAYDLFSSLGSYRDASQRAEELASSLGIEIQSEP